MNEAGFSLLEALIALLVLAIGAAGLVRASEAHVDAIGGLEQRAAATWVAQNRLAELRLADPAASAPSVAMLGRTWRVTVTTRANPDPDLREVAIEVRPDEGRGPAVALTGFIAS